MNKLNQTIALTNLKAQFNGVDVLPINIIGSRGTGKTSVVKLLVAQLDSHLLNCSIPSKDISYFGG